MIQREFADNAKTILEPDDNVIGLAVEGSWLTNEIDEYSDLDLILVTRQRISDDKNQDRCKTIIKVNLTTYLDLF
jgi:predicted nucleotidyltransferase